MFHIICLQSFTQLLELRRSQQSAVELTVILGYNLSEGGVCNAVMQTFSTMEGQENLRSSDFHVGKQTKHTFNNAATSSPI